MVAFLMGAMAWGAWEGCEFVSEKLCIPMKPMHDEKSVTIRAYVTVLEKRQIGEPLKLGTKIWNIVEEVFKESQNVPCGHFGSRQASFVPALPSLLLVLLGPCVHYGVG